MRRPSSERMKPAARFNSCMASSTHGFASPSPTVAARPAPSTLARRLLANQATTVGLGIVCVYILLGLTDGRSTVIDGGAASSALRR